MLLLGKDISYFAYAIQTLVYPNLRYCILIFDEKKTREYYRRRLLFFINYNVYDKLKNHAKKYEINIFFSNLLIVRSPNAACYRRFVVEHRRPISLTGDTPNQYETIL